MVMLKHKNIKAVQYKFAYIDNYKGSICNYNVNTAMKLIYGLFLNQYKVMFHI